MHDLNAWQLTRLTLAIANPVLNPFDPTPFPSVSSRVLPEETQQSQISVEDRANELEIDREILEGSPVLQEWLQDVPDVMEEIRHDRSFRTRVRFGYSQFSSTDDEEGFHVGIEDIFIGETGLTVSGEYQQTFDERYQALKEFKTANGVDQDPPLSSALLWPWIERIRTGTLELTSVDQMVVEAASSRPLCFLISPIAPMIPDLFDVNSALAMRSTALFIALSMRSWSIGFKI